ncbi:hypothetical protein TPA0906_07270 [Streptomyces olivaceus]|nr:hypothetical protein TPA0906_07270 [Streptomyces olivaceus]
MATALLPAHPDAPHLPCQTEQLENGRQDAGIPGDLRLPGLTRGEAVWSSRPSTATSDAPSAETVTAAPVHRQPDTVTAAGTVCRAGGGVPVSTPFGERSAGRGRVPPAGSAAVAAAGSGR